MSPSDGAGLISKLDEIDLQRCLLCSSDVPVYQRVPFIVRGYRPRPRSTAALLRTLFTVHNETGNIWTHLLPFGYYSIRALQVSRDLAHGEDPSGDRVALVEFVWVLVILLATSVCLLNSWSYHLCSCSDRGFSECMLRVDRAGIVCLVAASYASGIALGYRCAPRLRVFYLFFSAGVAAALTFAMARPQLIGNIQSFFITCVGLGLLPAAHMLCISPWEDIAVVAPYLAAMFGWYGIGAAFFVSRWPECRWPGRFDIWGHSHQLWHTCVLFAAASWIRGIYAMAFHFGALDCALRLSVSGDADL